MRMKIRVASLLIAYGLALPAASASACSMASGYKVPTNLELAAKGEVIVIATVIGEKRTGKDDWDRDIIVQPEILLKGNEMPETVTISGASLDSSSRMKARGSNPRELREPNPDAMMGGCVRYIFSKGMKLVLFLSRDKNGTLMPFRSSFSRDAEDVTGPDALWARAVQEYAKISIFPKSEWKKRLKLRAAELRLAQNDPDALAIAADMDIERAGKRLPPFD
jgi:hypothetical protein